MEVLEHGGLVDVCGREVIGVDVPFTYHCSRSRSIVREIRENQPNLRVDFNAQNKQGKWLIPF